MTEETPTPTVDEADQIARARLQTLSNDLAAWGDEYGLANDPYVSTLKQAIDSRDNLTAFATSDPHDLLPHPEPRSGQPVASIARILAILRNVLVFLPVAITWLSISRATEKFGEYADLAPEDEEKLSFLQFWQSGGPSNLDGFTQLSSTWRITDVAGGVVWIIAAVILLTGLASILEDVALRRQTKEEQRVDRSRTELAVKIMTGLQGNRSIDAQTIEESLALILNDLGQAARDVNLAAERLETSTTGVGSLTPRIEELTVQVDTLASKFSSDLQDGITGLANAVTALGSTLDGDLQRFMADVLAGLEEVTERLKTTSVGVEFGTKMLRDDLDAIHQRLSKIVHPQ